MAKKVKLTAGIQGRLIGGAVGGLGSAAFDSYVTPMLPDSLQNSPDITKIVAGAFLPAVMKNDMGRSLGDGLMMVGVANYAKNNFFDTTKTTTPSGDKPGGGGIGRVNPFSAYSQRIMVEGANREGRSPIASQSAVRGARRVVK